jgi:hypothetical protein
MTFPVLVLLLLHVLLVLGKTRRGRERRPPVAPRVRPEDVEVLRVPPTLTWSERAALEFRRETRTP